MLTGSLRIVALALAGAVCFPSCTPLTPAETSGPGPFSGGNAARAASDITRATNASGGEAYATGSRAMTAAQATTFIIAKHQASVRQRQVAIKRARAAQQKLVARAAAAAEREERAEKPRTPGKKTAASKPKTKAKLPRYIAVETVKEATTSPQAEKVVMIWDTQAEDIVGNNVYDISNPPPVGATSRFETYSAEYVGAGL